MESKLNGNKDNKLKKMEEQRSYFRDCNDVPFRPDSSATTQHHPWSKNQSKGTVYNYEQCPYCAVRTITLTEHIRFIHPDKLEYVECSHCRTVVPTIDLEQHVKTKHSKQDDVVECPHCHSLVNKRNLEKHFRKVHPEKVDLKCPHPGSGTVSSQTNSVQPETSVFLITGMLDRRNQSSWRCNFSKAELEKLGQKKNVIVRIKCGGKIFSFPYDYFRREIAHYAYKDDRAYYFRINQETYEIVTFRNHVIDAKKFEGDYGLTYSKTEGNLDRIKMAGDSTDRKNYQADGILQEDRIRPEGTETTKPTYSNTYDTRETSDSFIQKKQNSSTTTTGLVIPEPTGLKYFPYQLAGIEFLLNHDKVLLADEPGLGKTSQVIGVINMDTSITRVLVVCPASLKLMWKSEFKKWSFRELSVGIADSQKFPNTDIVIINYDILQSYYTRIRRMKWDLRVCDESHYLKNDGARRTRQVLGHWNSTKRHWDVEPIQARKNFMLTGTPIVNRPAELWTTLKALDPDNWKSYTYFTNRYCAAHYNQWGLDVSGAANLAELQNILRSTIMIRRLKADVLSELPPKLRQVIEFAVPDDLRLVIHDENEEWLKRESNIRELQERVVSLKSCANESEYREAVKKLSAAYRVAFSDMSRVRHRTALAKLPLVIDFLKDIIKNEKKIVVFAHHKDVVERIHKAFPSSVTLTGETPLIQRHENIDKFQKDRTILMFIGNIQVAGVGITLTASSHVVFAELDWVPGNVSQSEDRLHRIGQVNPVLVQHLVFEGSLDAKMAKTIVAKQEIIEQVLD